MDRVTLGLRQIFIEDTRNDTKEEAKKFEQEPLVDRRPRIASRNYG
jgi:hypothetical protein